MISLIAGLLRQLAEPPAQADRPVVYWIGYECWAVWNGESKPSPLARQAR